MVATAGRALSGARRGAVLEIETGITICDRIMWRAASGQGGGIWGER